MQHEYSLVSPEKVNLKFRLAGVGSRFVACFIDTLFQSLIILFILVLFRLFGSVWPGIVQSLGVEVPKLGQSLGLGVLAVLVVLSAAIYNGYFILFETVWNGQTPGKRFLKLRVVQENGLSLTFLMVLIRNLLRVIDALPFAYGIGIIAGLISKRNQRLGDMAAGTIVVRESMEEAPQTVEIEVHETAWSAAASLRIHQLNEKDYAVLKKYLLRQSSLKPEDACIMEEKLAAYFCEKLDVNYFQLEDRAEFLKQVAALYQQH